MEQIKKIKINGKEYSIGGTGGGSGQDGITPMLRINGITNEWEVSYDEGVTWASLGVKATGEDGQQGAQGEKGDKGDKGDNGENGYTPYIGANGNWWINGVDTGKPSCGGGSEGEGGQDGITPQLQINVDTNEWEVSYDYGATWLSLGVKATGEKGEAGAQGEQGEQGAKGDKGDDGYTPQKEIDYFTEEDKDEMVTRVLDALPEWTGGSY